MKKKKVLIVDDDHGIRESLRDLLLLEQYECVVAETGTKGLYLLNQEQPDIVVLDLQLPDMSGFQFCQMFKKDDSLRHIPVMMITARFTESHDKIQGFDLGADEYFTKPFDPVLFIARLKSILRAFEPSKVSAPDQPLLTAHH